MIKKTLLLATLALTALCAQAQYGKIDSKSPFARRFSYGVDLGIGSSHQQYTNSEVTGKPGTTYMAGLSGYLNMGSDLALIFQPQYEWRGQRSPLGAVRTDNITLPLTLAFTNGEGKGPLRYFIGLGGYYANALWGRWGGQPMDFSNNVNRDEWGWQVNLSLFYKHFGISWVSRQALSDVLQTVPDGGTNRRVWSNYAVISYAF